MPRWLRPVERQPRKLLVAGSNPARGFKTSLGFSYVLRARQTIWTQEVLLLRWDACIPRLLLADQELLLLARNLFACLFHFSYCFFWGLLPLCIENGSPFPFPTPFFQSSAAGARSRWLQQSSMHFTMKCSGHSTKTVSTFLNGSSGLFFMVL